MAKARFALHVTVNTLNHEVEYNNIETDSVDKTIGFVLQHHPSATSLLISIVPNKDLPSTFEVSHD